MKSMDGYGVVVVVACFVQVLVGVWVARYLGPEQFGLLNFAVAFISLFGAVASLGLQGIVVRNIVQDPVCKNETLGTAAALLLLSLVDGKNVFLWAKHHDNQVRY